MHAFPDGRALMSGASATVLRFAGRFERLPTPGLGQADGLRGLGGDARRLLRGRQRGAGATASSGTTTTARSRRSGSRSICPRVAHGEVPGFFKVWGTGDEVWVVGAGGAILHRHGKARSRVVPSGTTETLFTVHGAEAASSRWAAGATASRSRGSRPLRREGSTRHARGRAADPGRLHGPRRRDRFDWASGERGLIYTRPGRGPFQARRHELSIPAASSLHAIFVDPSHGVWSVGGNVLTPALDGGILVHFGAPVPA